MREWYVYLIRTRYGALYTGIATDVDRRLAEHRNTGKKGARYLRSKGPLQLAYSAKIGSRALALKAKPTHFLKRSTFQARPGTGAGERSRTSDQLITSQLLYQLSYASRKIIFICF